MNDMKYGPITPLKDILTIKWFYFKKNCNFLKCKNDIRRTYTYIITKLNKFLRIWTPSTPWGEHQPRTISIYSLCTCLKTSNDYFIFKRNLRSNNKIPAGVKTSKEIFALNFPIDFISADNNFIFRLNFQCLRWSFQLQTAQKVIIIPSDFNSIALINSRSKLIDLITFLPVFDFSNRVYFCLLVGNGDK